MPDTRRTRNSWTLGLTLGLLTVCAGAGEGDLYDVRVTTASGTVHEGRLLALQPEAVTLAADDGGAETVALDERTSVALRPAHYDKTRSLIGAGLGGAVFFGSLGAFVPFESGQRRGESIAVGAAGGALWGLAHELVAGRPGWRTLRVSSLRPGDRVRVQSTDGSPALKGQLLREDERGWTLKPDGQAEPLLVPREQLARLDVGLSHVRVKAFAVGALGGGLMALAFDCTSAPGHDWKCSEHVAARTAGFALTQGVLLAATVGSEMWTPWRGRSERVDPRSPELSVRPLVAHGAGGAQVTLRF